MLKNQNVYLEFRNIVLYYLYFSFFATIFLISRQSLAVQYAFSILDILILTSSILIIKKNNVNKWNYLVFIFLIIYSILALVKGTHINSPILFLKIYLIFIFFKLYTFKIEEIVRFLNSTYLLYALLSLFFFKFLPSTLYTLADHELNYVDLGFTKYLVLHSIEGGASTIDSYSALIFLSNIFLIKYKTKAHYFFIILSTLLIIYSLKMTPLVALIMGVISYTLIRNKTIATIYTILIFSIFIFVLNLLFVNPEVYGPVRFSSIMYVATHARSMIWVQQLTILIETYSIKDYIFGNFTSESFTVNAFQLTGHEITTNYDNPHNTYLLLFFKAPLLFIIYYLKYIFMIFKNFDRKSFVIISFIAVAGFSNSSIISLGNPVYLIIIAFLLTSPDFKSKKIIE